MPATTAMCSSFKAELGRSIHNFSAPVSQSGTTNTGNGQITGLGSVAGLVVGMPITGTGVAAGAVVASIDSASQVTASKNGTAAATNTLTFSGDTFKMALIKSGMAGTYGAATTNYSDVTGNSDEVTGTGYTAGGATLSANISPALSGTTAYWSWSTNPSWSGASFSAAAALIYNSSNRGLGATGNRAVSVHDFGGTQTVSSGTFTVVLPANDSTNAILRIT